MRFGDESLLDGAEPDQAEQDYGAAQELAALRQTHWQMRDGGFIAVVDMEDSHLINTIRMLRRNAASAKSEEESAGYSMLGYLRGEAAIDSVESDLNRLEDMTVDAWLEDTVLTWPAMLAEAEKRGLTSGIATVL